MVKTLSGLILSLLLALPAWAMVDVNTATQSELESLKGIGPTKAQAIIEYRKQNGPFKRLEDLENVKGIGKATVDKLRGQLTVGGDRKANRK
jgi:competence protein ComEA